jgi:hypothetical protein
VIGSRLTLRRSALAAAILFALAAVALVAAMPAAAAKTDNCAKAVVEDWYDNNRVDNIYPLHCYREAIKLLPVDVRDYSSAREDILRALAYAKQGKPDPGDGGSSGSGTSGTNGTGGTGSGTGGTGGTGGNAGDGSTVGEGDVDTSGPSAIPVPLIVLAAIAALLLALGAAGYLTRRRRGGDAPPAA